MKKITDFLDNLDLPLYSYNALQRKGTFLAVAVKFAAGQGLSMWMIRKVLVMPGVSGGNSRDGRDGTS